MSFLPEALAILLLTHVIGDYALQTDSIYKLKTSGGLFGLAVHVGIHVLITGLLLQFGFVRNWFLLLLLFILHFLVDLIKLQINTRFQFAAYIADQLIHVVCIFLLFWLFPSTETLLPQNWILPFLLYSIIPFVTMTLWVWYSEKQRSLKPDDETVLYQGFFGSMKQVSQITAIPLIVGVALWFQFQGVSLVELVIERYNLF